MKNVNIIRTGRSPFSIFNDFEKELAPFFESRNEYRPSLDLGIKEDHFYASLDIPGVKKENLKIEVEEDVVTISGSRDKEHKGSHYTEKTYGSFKRSVKVPKHFDIEKSEAVFENGVLRLLMPKKEEINSSRTIEIKNEKDGLFEKVFS